MNWRGHSEFSVTTARRWNGLSLCSSTNLLLKHLVVLSSDLRCFVNFFYRWIVWGIQLIWPSEAVDMGFFLSYFRCFWLRPKLLPALRWNCYWLLLGPLYLIICFRKSSHRQSNKLATRLHASALHAVALSAFSGLKLAAIVGPC